MTEPSILHPDQVVVDLCMNIDHLPERGGDIFARRSAMNVGSGYNVIRAARQMGAPIAYMGAIGTGPMAEMARGALGRTHLCFGKGRRTKRRQSPARMTSAKPDETKAAADSMPVAA